MAILKIKRNTVETYESLSEMPMRNFHLFNKFIVLNSNIGSDLDSIQDRVQKVRRFVAQQDGKKADAELNNLLQALTFAVENVPTDSLAFVCLCRRINNRDVIIMDDESAIRWQQRLSRYGSPMGLIWDTIGRLKKKFDGELNLFFPGLLDSAGEKQYYNRLLQKTRLQLKNLYQDEDYSDEIQEIENYLLDMYKPTVFHGPDGAEVNFFKTYQDNCAIINQNTNIDAASLTVIEFLQTLDYLKRQFKKLKKNAN